MASGDWRDAVAHGHAARREGRLDAALAHYRSAVVQAPDDSEANSLYGLMLLELDRVDEAATSLKRAVEIDPANPATRINLAELEVKRGNLQEAISIVESLAAEHPRLWWVWDRLGELNVRAGRPAGAVEHFRRANDLRPNDPHLLLRWARAVLDSAGPAAAGPILATAARLAPTDERILGMQAEIHESAEDWASLRRIAHAWMTAHPQSPAPWRHAATALWQTGHRRQALRLHRAFLERGGGSATDLAEYGRLCAVALDYAEAARALDAAERQDAGCVPMLTAKAMLSMFQGRFDEALAYARRAIAADSRDVAAYKVLVRVNGAAIADKERAQLAFLAEDADLRLQDRITAAFALADCFDAQGDDDAAFPMYTRAHELCLERARNEGFAYNRARVRAQTDRFIAHFADAPPVMRTQGHPVPIFIVGMPRSGTTMVESILGAHSRVKACGERDEMGLILQEFEAEVARGGSTQISDVARQRWREAYWREIPDPGDALAVTDKNPWNFEALGLILHLFPEARVIHVRRDPVETCLSIFRNEFARHVSFVNRLTDIGHYYGEYARLMAHWDGILGNRFLTVQYEDLVADVHAHAARILEFSGLDWENACANFWTSPHVVNTISSVQVRQPPSGFSGRRHRYARHLEPLIAALRDAGVHLESGALAR